VDDTSLMVGNFKFIGLEWSPTSPTRRDMADRGPALPFAWEEQGYAIAIGDMRTLKLR
jgi:hypothetical protein